MPEEMVSVIEGETMGTPATPARQISHWLGPVITAIMLLLGLAGYVFTAGSTAQRLNTVETNVEKLETNTVKHSEIDYRLSSIDNRLSTIDGKLDRLQERRR